MVISYIMRRQNQHLKDAYQFVKSKRSIISPNFGNFHLSLLNTLEKDERVSQLFLGFIKQLLLFQGILFPTADKIDFEIFFTRLQMYHERPDITDGEIRDALLASDHNVQKAIYLLDTTKPYSPTK